MYNVARPRAVRNPRRISFNPPVIRLRPRFSSLFFEVIFRPNSWPADDLAQVSEKPDTPPKWSGIARPECELVGSARSARSNAVRCLKRLIVLGFRIASLRTRVRQRASHARRLNVRLSLIINTTPSVGPVAASHLMRRARTTPRGRFGIADFCRIFRFSVRHSRRYAGATVCYTATSIARSDMSSWGFTAPCH